MGFHQAGLCRADIEFQVEFRICPHLSKKPHTVGALLNAAFDKGRKWGPGSDMYCPDERLIMGKLNGTHDLALNLFCVDRPQLLLLTLDSYQRQHEALASDDFAAALETLKLFPNMYVIFNCSEAGGCSRVHKHLQGLRGPPHAFDLLVREGKDKAKVPFQYFTHRFEQGFECASALDVLGIYSTLLQQTREALGVGADDVCPHNMVMWDDTLVVIPRRKGVTEGASANAGGMLGSVWISDQKHVDEWTRIGCANVLRELGLPTK
jgi:ATP adenylyltransferase/5',5'''-P-1,P-4-tetraphosphate phosphorylase II